MEVGIAETENITFLKDQTRNFRLFFDGKHGSTNLDTSGKIDGQSKVLTSTGAVRVTLEAVLDARLDPSGAVYPSLVRQLSQDPPPASQFSGGPFYVGDFGPQLYAKVVKKNGLKAKDGPLQKNVGLWVDERSYAHVRSQNGNWIKIKDQDGNDKDIANDVRDWLEKKVLDFYATWTGNDEIVAGMQRLSFLTDTTRQLDKNQACDFDALTIGGKNVGVSPDIKVATASQVWCASNVQVRRQPEPTFNVIHDEAGLAVDKANPDFNLTAIHEARHIWQYTLTDCCGAADPDFDRLPTLGPGSATILTDDRYLFQGRGTNPEFDFLAPNFPDLNTWVVGGAEAGEAAREADAIRLSTAIMQQPAACLPSGNYRHSLSAIPLGDGSGWRLLENVSVTNRDSSSHAYEGVTVTFTVQSGTMLLSEYVVGELFPDPVALGIDPASLFRPDGPVAVCRTRFKDDTHTATEARVWLKKGPSPSPTTIKATVIVPSECGSLQVTDVITLP
jgi:hypothetical protein